LGLANNIEEYTLKERFFLPNKINFFEKFDIKIKKIKLGFKHTIFLNECGAYFCGDNSKGASGIKSDLISCENKFKNTNLKLIKMNCYIPVEFDKIQNFFCGWHNTFFLTSKNKFRKN